MTPPQVEYREIQLTQNQIAYVSPSRYDEINSFKWSARWDKTAKGFYAIRNEVGEGGRRYTISMHRHILGLWYGDPREGDHIDPARTLDNTDENLRIVARQQQNCNQRIRRDNTSGYKGVTLHKGCGLWVAQISVDGKRKHLGTYPTKELAYAAYCNAARISHGEYAHLEELPLMSNEKVDNIVELAGKLAGRADEVDEVLIIYRNKSDGSQGSMDNGLTLAESLWLVEGFRFWLQAGAMGILKEKSDE